MTLHRRLLQCGPAVSPAVRAAVLRSSTMHKNNNAARLGDQGNNFVHRGVILTPQKDKARKAPDERVQHEVHSDDAGGREAVPEDEIPSALF